MGLLDTIKENETLQWAVDKFMKIGLCGFLGVSIVLIAKAVFGFHFDITGGFTF